MRLRVPFVICWLAALVTATSALAVPGGERRVALVIGNSAYTNVSELANPVNDANDVASKLRKLSFDIILGTNLTRAQMKDAFERFTTDVKGGAVGVFYYAGHGISLAGENFLIPIDMPSEIQIGTEAESRPALDAHLVNVAEVMGALQTAKLGIVFLDACRNTPSREELGLQIVAADGGTRRLRSLSFMRGITKLPSSSTSGASGIFRAYATQPNNVSDDGGGRNSPFTKALLKHLETPGLDIHEMMRKVRLEVQTETNGRQIPWEESALTNAYYFLPPSPGLQSPSAPVVPGGRVDRPARPRAAAAPSAPRRSSGSGAPPGLGMGVGGGL